MNFHKNAMNNYWTVENTEQIFQNKITLISFICSILVIYIHTNNLETYGIDKNSIGIARVLYVGESYWFKVVQVAVPLFFCISGILFFRTFEISKLMEKWKSRFYSIVVPYIIWCTLYYLYNVLCTNIPMIKDMIAGCTVVELSITEWIKWLWVNEYYTLWFLQNLIIYIAITPIIWLLLKERIKKIPIGLCILVLLLACKKYLNVSFANMQGIEFYLVGSYIGLNCREEIKYKNRIISIFSIIYIGFILITSFRYWNFELELLFFFAIWYAIDFLMTSLNCQLPWWMSITFFTYVAHDFILEAFEKILWILGGNRPIFALLDYIFMPVIVEILLIGIAYILKTYFTPLWRVINGSRGMNK